jgi:cytochrome b6-f complex iron-sulfur subunit
MDRKHFVKIIGVSCIGAAFPIGFSSCSPVHYVTIELNNQQLSIPKSEFTGIKKDVEFIRAFVVVESPTLQFPIAVYRHSEKKYSALWTECTHQNCEVKPHDTLLTCPCHGSEYDISGGVLEGPAESALKSFQVSSDNETVYVHLV